MKMTILGDIFIIFKHKLLYYVSKFVSCRCMRVLRNKLGTTGSFKRYGYPVKVG